MTDDTDPLDQFLQPEPETTAADPFRFQGMVVRPRAKDSAEIDERERAMLNGKLDNSLMWPIPVYGDDRMTPDPLTKSEIEILRDIFGVTPEEWLALYTRERPLP